MPASGGTGDLEREIIAILWRGGRSTVRQVYRQVARTRDLAYTTVMTTMIRLVEQGVLRQERRRGARHPHSFVYRLGASEAERRRLSETLHS